MIQIENIKIPARKEADLKEFVYKKYKVFANDVKDFKILKKSLDSRDKNNILYVYSVMISLPNNIEKILLNKNEVSLYKPVKYIPVTSVGSKSRICIIGMGPAGLFAGYTLALAGLNPIIFERGRKIEDRVKDVDEFFDFGKMKEESNIQFGEGGAGTFSDGKLNTGVKDKNGYKDFILETFVKFGANENILYDAKPHIGTDVLRKVIVNMRNEIIRLGGVVRFESKLISFESEKNTIKSIQILSANKVESISCDKMILAIGHSSRDTFEYLKNKLQMEQKPFAVGFRVIHRQSDIDKSQYGEYFESQYENLPPCSYKLTYQSEKYQRGVYSFCMCPGGYVVNASSESERTCVNGMSMNKRDSGFANSALIVQIKPEDLNNDDVLAGMNFQRDIEYKTYHKGNGCIPVSKYSNFDKTKFEFNDSFEIIPKEAFKGNIKESDLSDIYPDFINESFKEGMDYFEHRIKGFKSLNPILAGCETRTSSPVKIIRDEFLESNIKGIYPCGEGAGYAGGIVSAAMDGIKTADYIIKEIQ